MYEVSNLNLDKLITNSLFIQLLFLVFLVFFVLYIVIVFWWWLKNQLKFLHKSIKKEIEYSINFSKIQMNQTTKDLVKLAIKIWRIKKRLKGIVSSLDDQQKKKVEYALRDINRYLKHKDIQIEDLEGEKFNEGMNLKVVSRTKAKKNREIKYPIIKKTITPTIFYKDKVIKKGEIIVSGN